MRCALLLLAATLCPTALSCGAEITSGGNVGPLYKLVQCGFMDELNAKLDAQVFIAGDIASLRKMQPELDAVRKCLDGQIAATIDAADGHAEAVSAVKAYYIARKAKLDAMLPLAHETERAYDARLAQFVAGIDEKQERAELEWKLAKLPEG